MTGGARCVIDLRDVHRELSGSCRSTRGAVQDRVGDFDWSVVVVTTGETIVARGEHRERTRDDITCVIVTADVNRYRRVTDRVLGDRALVVRDVGELCDR